MTKASQQYRLIILACGASLACAVPAMAAMVELQADLKASNEVPPNESTGTGSVTATFDTDSNKLSWKGAVSGLSGPVTAAHFHAAEAGRNGAVAVAIIGVDKGSFEGSATHRHSSRRSDGGQMVRQYPHRHSQGWRNSWSGKKMTVYSIISSVRVRSVGVISKPIALAALRLTSSSNLVGSWTGRSAGLAPLRILPI